MSRHTLDQWIRDRARTTPGRVAIDYDDRLVTYRELDDRSDELARDLRHGEVVSTLTGNSPEHVVLFFGCAKAGAETSMPAPSNTAKPRDRCFDAYPMSARISTAAQCL